MSTLKDLPKARNYFEDKVYNEVLSMETSKSIGDIINKVSDFVLAEGKSITTSQLRNIYARIKKANSPEDLQLLRPVLAYTSARQKGEGGKIIIALLDDLIQKIKDENQVASFQTFAEAIVAYHKYHHPKQS
jgi:CRISPR type III-A-associated protein Csm2